MNRGYTSKESVEFGKCIMAGLTSGFEKVMNPPEEGFDGQADIKVFSDRKWVVCPYCRKKQLKINSNTKVEKMPYICKNNKCKREFIINV